MAENDGTGHFDSQPIASIGLGMASPAIVAADFDADGTMDFATAKNPQTGNAASLEVFSYKGTLPVESTSYRLDYSVARLHLADFNADGADDLVIWRGPYSRGNEIEVRFNDGDGEFDRGFRLDPGRPLSHVGTGDVDHDGFVDFLILDERDALNVFFADWGDAGRDRGDRNRGDNAVWLEYIAPPTFSRGDANQNGRLEVSDGVFVLDYLFRRGTMPLCMKAADADDDGRLRITDPVVILQSLHVTGAALPAPPRRCGVDPTSDSLTCGAFASCR